MPRQTSSHNAWVREVERYLFLLCSDLSTFPTLEKACRFQWRTQQSAWRACSGRHMLVVLPPTRAALLSAHEPACGTRKAQRNQAWKKAITLASGTAPLNLAASIRPKSGCSGVRPHSRTQSLWGGRVLKRSETSSGHVQSTLHLHPHAHCRAPQDAQHVQGTSSRMARTVPVRAPSWHARGVCMAARAQGCDTGGGSMLWAVTRLCTGGCKGMWAVRAEMDRAGDKRRALPSIAQSWVD